MIGDVAEPRNLMPKKHKFSFFVVNIHEISTIKSLFIFTINFWGLVPVMFNAFGKSSVLRFKTVIDAIKLYKYLKITLLQSINSHLTSF